MPPKTFLLWPGSKTDLPILGAWKQSRFGNCSLKGKKGICWFVFTSPLATWLCWIVYVRRPCTVWRIFAGNLCGIPPPHQHLAGFLIVVFSSHDLTFSLILNAFNIGQDLPDRQPCVQFRKSQKVPNPFTVTCSPENPERSGPNSQCAFKFKSKCVKVRKVQTELCTRTTKTCWPSLVTITLQFMWYSWEYWNMLY